MIEDPNLVWLHDQYCYPRKSELLQRLFENPPF